MRVFLAGATGEIGRSIVRLLHASGDSSVGLCRRPENDAVLRRLGVEPRAGSLFDEESLVRAAQGCDAVVQGDFVRALARLDGAPSPLELPFSLTRLLGDVARNAFLDATVTSNRRLRAELAWAPRYPTLESGLASLA